MNFTKSIKFGLRERWKREGERERGKEREGEREKKREKEAIDRSGKNYKNNFFFRMNMRKKIVVDKFIDDEIDWLNFHSILFINFDFIF